MSAETALSCERAKSCEWCAKGVLLDWGVHLIPLPKPSQWMWQEPPYERHTCAAPAIEYLYEELAKERDELATALHDCLGILKIALNGLSGALVNVVCEEELPRFERLEAIRAAREKEKA